MVVSLAGHSRASVVIILLLVIVVAALRVVVSWLLLVLLTWRHGTAWRSTVRLLVAGDIVAVGTIFSARCIVVEVALLVQAWKRR